MKRIHAKLFIDKVSCSKKCRQIDKTSRANILTTVGSTCTFFLPLYIFWIFRGNFFLFFGGSRIWTQGFPFCKAGALPLESHLQSILLWLFWDGVSRTICPVRPQSEILTTSASQVAGITGVSPQCLAYGNFLNESHF
jgi:hypothetical protein